MPSSSRCMSTQSVRLSEEIAALKGDAKVLYNEFQVLLRKMDGRGRAIYALQDYSPGDVVLHEATPLVAVGDPTVDPSIFCAHCFRSLELQGVGSVTCGKGCGTYYCSDECAEGHWRSGHDALCGGTAALDLWCKTNKMNFPRVAAAALARSLSADVDFVDYWTRTNNLAHASLPDTDEFPRAWTEGYDLMKNAFLDAGHMSGDLNAFFEHAFNLRAYGRFMNTLRLNSISVPCPIDADHASSSSSTVPTSTPVVPSLPPEAEAGCCSDPLDPLPPPPCGSEETSNKADGNASGGGCSTSLPALGEARGGTALYHYISMSNHTCDPNLDLVMERGGAAALRARKPIAAGDELCITYIDSSLDVEFRRSRLYKGYGFLCKCSLCKEQMEAQGKRL